MSSLMRVANLIEKEIEKGNISGANICVIRNNEELYSGSFGYANIEKKILMKRDTIFRMFSMSKPVTAVATMILFERGEIDLFDPVSKYLEGFKNQKVYINNEVFDVNKEVTIKDLLNMTSGIPYPNEESNSGIDMDKLYKNIKDKLEMGIKTNTLDYCNAIGRVPLAFEPGERWMYGASADILGGIIEVVSGKKFGEFLKDEIFDLLDMKDTGFYVPDEKQDRFAQIYKYDDKINELRPFLDNHLGLEGYKSDTAFQSGGAGLVSTIDDYKKFALMLLNKGTYKGIRILGSKTIDFMVKNQLTSKQLNQLDWESLKGYGYGNLMRVLVDKSQCSSNGSLGEYGWDGWAGNYFTVNPEENLVILYFIQRCDTGMDNVTRKIRNIIYSTL